MLWCPGRTDDPGCPEAAVEGGAALPVTRPAEPQQPSSGWAFATQVVGEEPATDDVVVGIISINNVRCRALFDTGASLSS